MNPVGNNRQRFIDLIDRAIDLVEERLTSRLAGMNDSLSPDQLRCLLSVLDKYKKQVSSGNLESSKGGQVRLGLSRAVIDWGEPAGTTLRKTLFDIENYYENDW